MENLHPAVLSALVAGLLVVVWALLRKKDADQERQIALLFQKHDEDVERLRALELKIAEEHYRKSDLDPKFDKLEVMLRDGMASLGGKFDAFSVALLTRIAKDDREKKT